MCWIPFEINGRNKCECYVIACFRRQSPEECLSEIAPVYSVAFILLQCGRYFGHRIVFVRVIERQLSKAPVSQLLYFAFETGMGADVLEEWRLVMQPNQVLLLFAVLEVAIEATQLGLNQVLQKPIDGFVIVKDDEEYDKHGQVHRFEHFAWYSINRQSIR